MIAKDKVLLIVEDESGIRQALTMVFEDEGYRVITAANGREALKQIQGTAVDLVVTDILMPEFDGLELIRYLKKNNPTIKSIVISGGDPQYLQVSKCLGAHAILQKPFSKDTLQKMVTKLLTSSD